MEFFRLSFTVQTLHNLDAKATLFTRGDCQTAHNVLLLRWQWDCCDGSAVNGPGARLHNGLASFEPNDSTSFEVWVSLSFRMPPESGGSLQIS